MNSINISLPKWFRDYTSLNDEKEIARKYSTIIWNSMSVDLERIKELIQEDWVVKISINHSKYSENILKWFLLWICSYLGEPTYTDQIEKKILWNVSPKVNTNVFTTFSEKDGEALLHTDSQFYPNPEKYFLLYCSVPAKEWWDSYLVEIKDILEQLKHEINWEDILKFLREIKVPFRVPSVFTKTWNDESIEIYTSTILSRNNKEIRFRVDTVEEALKIAPSLLTEKEKNLFKDFQEIIETRVKKIDLGLKSWEGLIIDNKRFLHWRTTFNDPNRLLYRIRFNDKLYAK